jgi:hypothetical protein
VSDNLLENIDISVFEAHHNELPGRCPWLRCPEIGLRKWDEVKGRKRNAYQIVTAALGYGKFDFGYSGYGTGIGKSRRGDFDLSVPLESQ